MPADKSYSETRCRTETISNEAEALGRLFRIRGPNASSTCVPPDACIGCQIESSLLADCLYDVVARLVPCGTCRERHNVAKIT